MLHCRTATKVARDIIFQITNICANAHRNVLGGVIFFNMNYLQIQGTVFNRGLEGKSCPKYVPKNSILYKDYLKGKKQYKLLKKKEKMTAIEAKISALEAIASSVNLILNHVDFSIDDNGKTIRNQQEVDKIIKEMDIIAGKLNLQANKLKNSLRS